MKGLAIILRTETFIEPFGDHVSQAFFTRETLAETQDASFKTVGFEVVRASTVKDALAAIKNANKPVLLMLDRVYVSEKALKDFLKAAKKTRRPAALSLEINASVEFCLPIQDVLREKDLIIHDVVLIDPQNLPPSDESSNVAWLRKIRDSAEKVPVKKREIVIDVPLPVIDPSQREKAVMRYPVTSTVVVSIEHWVHVLWLNQIAFGIRWMEHIRRHPLWTILRIFSGFSLDRDRVLERLVKRGKNVRIHPTAYVSGSILGDNVRIGAHATVRNSIVGDNVVLEDHAVLLNSVVGPSCFISANTFVVSCAIYPESTVGNHKIQVSLIGRNAYINAWAGFVDAKFVGHVMVPHNGELRSTERSFLGSVVGHRAKVGAKILIMPGRAIPNDTVIVMRPDEVVSDIPENLPKGVPVVRDKGSLVPVGQERGPL